MKLVYFGTSEFAVPILRAIMGKASWEIVAVVTEPAKPVGRRQEIVESPVSIYARSAGLKVITPLSFRSPAVEDQIKSAQPDVIIVAAYGKIIPPEIFNLPLHKTINIHPSLLPQLRGPSPIQTALKDGLKKTGVSLMIIDERVDHGPILSQDSFPIASDDTYLILEKKLSQLGADMLIRDLPQYISGELKPKEQNHSEATFTKMIKKGDGSIDWTKSADEIYNQWRAFIKWPGIYTFFRRSTRSNLLWEVQPPLKTRLRLLEINISRECDRILVIHQTNSSDSSKMPGTVFLDENKNLLIACSQGAVQLVKIQPEGGKILTAQEFLNGYRDIVGQVLY